MSRLKYLIATFFLVSVAGCATGCESLPNDSAIVDEDVPTIISETEPEPSPITWDDCGGAVGDHPCDFTFIDQDGNEWNLYSHYGDVMILDFSTMWCGYCKVAAADVQAMQDLYGPDGFIWVTLLIDDAAGGDVDLAEVQAWANEYGIVSAPVLVADRSIIDLSAEDGYPVSSWPTFVLIDEEMVINWGLRGWNQEMIINAIEGLLDE